MSAYKVKKDNHMFYVMPFDVETYIRKGYDLYEEIRTPISDIEAEVKFIDDNATSGIPDYWASKDGISFKIQPFRMLEFSNRGYEILTKHLFKIEDVDAEIDKINSSDSIIPLGEFI